MNYVGDYTAGSIVYIYFNTFDSNDPSASVTMTNFINTDVHIHKNDDLTQRNDAAGVMVDVDVDGIVGCHLIKIDTADNTVADFFVAGADYGVRIEGVTVDAATLNPFVGHFSLENRHVAGSMMKTTIATLASQTSFTLTAGSVDNNAYLNCAIIVSDPASAIQKCVGRISAYTGATKTVTLAADPAVFTMAAKDNVHIIATSALANIDAYQGVLAVAGAIPAVAADGAGGLPISDAGGLDLDAQLAATNEVTAARMAALTDWINGGRLDLLLDAIKAITDALPDAGTLTTIGTDTARLTAVRAAVLTDWINGGRLDLLLDAIPTTAMRGTDNAALASVATEARLAELDAANIPADVDAILVDTGTTLDNHLTDIKGTSFVKDTHSLIDIEGYVDLIDDGTSGLAKIATDAAAILVDTTGLNGDAMRGTDSAALASVATEARLAELDAANLPTDVAAVKTDTAAILTDTADIQPKLGAPAGTDMSADIAAVKTDTAAILVDTGTTLDGRIPAALVGGRMDADVSAISTSTAAADNLEASAEVIIIGAAEAGTLSTTQMTTNLTEATNEHYNGRIVIWTSGVLLGQASDISAYLGSTGRLTYTAVTEAPSAGDTFVIV